MSLPQILLLNAALITAVMISLWLLSLRLRDASIVDIFWGLGFVMIAWVTFAVTAGHLRGLFLTWLTTLWGLRLSGYLAWRNVGKGEDPRYRAMREHHGERFKWVSFLTVFGLQGSIMWLIALPVQVGQTAAAPMTPWNYIGVGIWCVGFLFEAIGDFQLARFKSDDRNSGKVMDRGLWRYTRHPNYFGNALVWWGLGLVALTTSTAWVLVSPIVMTILLIKVSGVALLERSLKSRSAEYRDYVLRTSSFIPRRPKSPPNPGLDR